jgi:hypothetical protein
VLGEYRLEYRAQRLAERLHGRGGHSPHFAGIQIGAASDPGCLGAGQCGPPSIVPVLQLRQ